MRSILFAALFLSLFAPVVASAAPAQQETIVEVSPIYDPIEPFNRAVFQFNRFVDFIVLKPITTVYTTVLPQFMQNSVTNFLTNLGTPIVMLNTALQGDWTGFETSLHRLVINSTLGVGGLVDVASDLKLQPVKADFGQTLGKWGIGQGFYLVLPIVGPSSVRDGGGRVVDAFLDPYNIAFMESGTEWPIWARAGLTVVDARARYGADYDRTMRNAVDPYVTFRSIYSQNRTYMVQGKSVDAYAAVEAQ